MTQRLGTWCSQTSWPSAETSMIRLPPGPWYWAIMMARPCRGSPAEPRTIARRRRSVRMRPVLPSDGGATLLPGARSEGLARDPGPVAGRLVAEVPLRGGGLRGEAARREVGDDDALEVADRA